MRWWWGNENPSSETAISSINAIYEGSFVRVGVNQPLDEKWNLARRQI
jgi:hypothetical protein